MTEELQFHYVCTLDEMRQMVAERKDFWISDCDCEEIRGPCKVTGIFRCLQFSDEKVSPGQNRRKVSREEVLQLLDTARKDHLVPRPFRAEDDMLHTYGACFCCECCCDYFATEEHSPCNQGIYIEVTDMDLCNHCGTCEEFCYFKARPWNGEELTIISDECYGCGVCVDVCPEEAIRMELRG